MEADWWAMGELGIPDMRVAVALEKLVRGEEVLAPKVE